MGPTVAKCKGLIYTHNSQVLLCWGFLDHSHQSPTSFRRDCTESPLFLKVFFHLQLKVLCFFSFLPRSPPMATNKRCGWATVPKRLQRPSTICPEWWQPYNYTRLLVYSVGLVVPYLAYWCIYCSWWCNHCDFFGAWSHLVVGGLMSNLCLNIEKHRNT